MSHYQSLVTTLFLLGVSLMVLPSCTSSGMAAGPVQLQGDATCAGPMSVSGTARDTGTGTVQVTATLRCGPSNEGVAGAVLSSRIPGPDGPIDRPFPPTNEDGTATLTLDVSDFDIVPSRVQVRALDASGEVIDTFSIMIE